MAGVKRRINTDSDIRALQKELDEVSCPICMDHPHNAVLLLCSSHEKGCRAYICDTSYRHSNCLDRFKKLRADSRSSSSLPSPLTINSVSSNVASDMTLAFSNDPLDINETNRSNGNDRMRINGLSEELLENSNRGNDRVSINELSEGLLGNTNGGDGTQDDNVNLENQDQGIAETSDSQPFQERIELEDTDVEISSDTKHGMKCPLCRGPVQGWKVVEEARRYLNLKRRSCSRESCSYSGNYQELRRHARRIHPMIRPSEVDPTRERAWRRLERQREYGDIVSAIRSAIPGAVVVGDYVIENGDRGPVERDNGTGEASGPLFSFFLFQMIGSMESAGEPRSRSRPWTSYRRPGVSERRMLWGENLLGLQDDDNDGDGSDDDVHVLSDADEDASPIPRRRRRRLMRSRSDEDQS